MPTAQQESPSTVHSTLSHVGELGRAFWRRLNLADRLALAAVLIYALLALFGLAERRVPGIAILRIVVIVAAGYLVVRGMLWTRAQWLWSMRNQLIDLYVFLAVVPLVLLLAMGALSLYLLYWHFGAYLLYADLEKRIDQVQSTADTLITAYALESAASGAGAPVGPVTAPPPRREAFFAAAQENFPGLKIELGAGQELLARGSGGRRPRFEGLVEDHGMLKLRAVTARRLLNGQEIVLSAEVPVTPEFVATLGPQLGPVEVVIARAAQQGPPPAFFYRSRGSILVPVQQVQAAGRALPPRRHWFDFRVTGFVRLDAVNLADVSNPRAAVPVIVRYTAWASQINGLLLALVGEWGGIAVTALLVAGAIFLLIEIAAFAGSISLTRSMTRAVDDLYQATRYVESGDFSHRIEIRRRDQLGALASSFNSMTASVATLIDEQRQLQRLEHELAIAREVQAQLFPTEKPAVQGVEIEAVCRPARVVSGDYYDFLPLGPGRLGLALADISGKGISAALIMASLQAALRSQALFDGRGPGSTAEIVARLNQHLFRSTSADRYATFFYGVYDAQTRRLEYTNAGHPPPLCITGDKVQRLSVGGTVLGLFDDRRYESQVIEVPPESLLIAYSDGLTEAEDPDGRELGEQRLLDVVLRLRQETARVVLKSVLEAVDRWTGPVEQMDDITIIVARF
jgi:phosphoserine phosphatase RsbU/P